MNFTHTLRRTLLTIAGVAGALMMAAAPSFAATTVSPNPATPGQQVTITWDPVCLESAPLQIYVPVRNLARTANYGEVLVSNPTSVQQVPLDAGQYLLESDSVPSCNAQFTVAENGAVPIVDLRVGVGAAVALGGSAVMFRRRRRRSTVAAI